MSRLGKKGLIIPAGIAVTQEGTTIKVKGPLGEVLRDFPGLVSVHIEGDKISLSPKNKSGVRKIFEKKLVIDGVGYKVEHQGNTLVFSLGFSHKVPVEVPKDIKAVVEKNVLTLTSINKESVGQFASQIRARKKPEPYKGKGIHYSDEVIRRKQGKKTA
ncbi:MAG: 50S ribosomal protein L6 [Candidatus Yonathbacteria bacterium]|nr:50S ribosomal protein L6 [Candidatus Yonathbacteria bacterium]